MVVAVNSPRRKVKTADRNARSGSVPDLSRVFSVNVVASGYKDGKERD